MARVLLMTSPEKGHLNPMAGVAQWLRREGHQVGWLCLPEPAEQVRRLDVEVLHLDGHAPAPPLVTGGEALARLVRDAEALRAWIRTLLLDAVPAQVEPVRGALRGYDPDVVALDGMLYQGVIACHLESIPYVGVSSALTLLEPPELDYDLMSDVRSLAEDRAALFRAYGMEPRFRTCECLSPVLNTIFACQALVGPEARVPPRTRLVGPSIPLGRRGDEPDLPAHALEGQEPLLYVSFGSQISWQPEIFARIAEAAAPLGARLVLSAGELARNGFVTSLPGRRRGPRVRAPARGPRASRGLRDPRRRELGDGGDVGGSAPARASRVQRSARAGPLRDAGGGRLRAGSVAARGRAPPRGPRVAPGAREPVPAGGAPHPGLLPPAGRCP